MSTSLAKIKNQIAKLQKQAATIETGIVARIKAEIAKHGLTAEQLFGGSSTVGSVSSAAKPKATAKMGTVRAAKFADGAGNTWGGMGKRPEWIRAALEAGKSLEDFLVGGKKASAVKTKPAVKAAPAKKAKVVKKAAPTKGAAAKKAAPAKAAAAPTAAKRSVRAAAKKTAVKKPTKARGAAAAVEPAQTPEA